LFSVPVSSLLSGVFHQQQLQAIEGVDEKPQIFNPQMIMNQNQAHYAQMGIGVVVLLCNGYVSVEGFAVNLK
jgi:hypothetical protein